MSVFSSNFSLSDKEQDQILEEAENWIDDMPDGLQDRLSDAVNHAIHGFYSEIEYFRNYVDTANLKNYNVEIKNIEGGKLGDISMRYYSSTSQTSPLLIYFHGGGWSMGSLETSDNFCKALAAEGKVKIISIDYPLAPENPYPAAIKHCVEGVEYIFNKAGDLGFDTRHVSLGGDGAGGNLALQVLSVLPDEIKINSLVLYYPLLKTTGQLDSKSKRQFGRGFGFDSRLWEAFIEAYKGKDSLSLENLPETLIISAGRDIIFEEKNLITSTNPQQVVSVIMEGALHGFLTDGKQPTAFQKAVELTNLFLSK